MSTRSSLGLAARHRVLGVAFLALLLLFVWFTTAVFTKKFVDYVPVKLTSSSIGLQLPALADVKIRGLLVGDVRSVSSNGRGATLVPRDLPGPGARDPGERDGADRAEDVVR